LPRSKSAASPPPFVDIHAHVLPGLDDGARTIEESIEMVKLAAACGTTDLVATPHASPAYPFDETHTHQAFRALSTRTAGMVNLHLGCDFHLNSQNFEDAFAKPTKYTINHGPYLLIELPEFVGFSAIRRQLAAFVNARIVPVITHPERNLQLQSDIGRLKVCVGDGCLLQVTAQSLLGRFGSTARRSAERLMNAGLVHFIASDAHDCAARPPDLSLAFQQVRNRWGKRAAQRLFLENPSAVLSGLPVSATHAAPSLWRRLLIPRSIGG